MDDTLTQVVMGSRAEDGETFSEDEMVTQVVNGTPTQDGETHLNDTCSQVVVATRAEDGDARLDDALKQAVTGTHVEGGEAHLDHDTFTHVVSGSPPDSLASESDHSPHGDGLKCNELDNDDSYCESMLTNTACPSSFSVGLREGLRLAEGTAVLVSGLRSATHLNNLVGIIEAYNERSERYEVRFAPTIAPSLIRASSFVFAPTISACIPCSQVHLLAAILDASLSEDVIIRNFLSRGCPSLPTSP